MREVELVDLNLRRQIRSQLDGGRCTFNSNLLSAPSTTKVALRTMACVGDERREDECPVGSITSKHPMHEAFTIGDALTCSRTSWVIGHP